MMSLSGHWIHIFPDSKLMTHYVANDWTSKTTDKHILVWFTNISHTSHLQYLVLASHWCRTIRYNINQIFKANEHPHSQIFPMVILLESSFLKNPPIDCRWSAVVFPTWRILQAGHRIRKMAIPKVEDQASFWSVPSNSTQMINVWIRSFWWR